MQNPLLQTKLYIPATRSNLIARARLVQKLNSGLGEVLTAFERNLSLVSAPAGFGKTSLITQWLTQLDRPTAWIALDGDDNAPQQFFAYMALAVQKMEGVGQSLSDLLQSPEAIEAKSLVMAFINDVTRAASPFLLILDDYHLIGSAEIDLTMAYLLDHMPPQMHLVLISRRDPGFPLSRLRAQSQMTEVRAEDLRFTMTEASTFLRQGMRLSLNSEQITALENRTEGWIAGLQMAALSLQSREDIAGFITAFTGDDRHIVDYLVDEVLARQTENTQSFLLQTSILDRLSGPLCDAVLDRDDGQQRLEALEQANLFVVPLDSRRQWFRYHALFGDFLQHRLRTQQPALLPLLFRRAAQWYDDNDELYPAIDYALDGAHFDWAAQRIEQVGEAMMRNREFAKLSGWLELLPNALSRTRPWLGIYRGWVLHHVGRMDAMAQQIENVEHALQALSPPRHAASDTNFEGSVGDHVDGSPRSSVDPTEAQKIQGHISAMRMYLALYHEDTAHAIEFARQTLENLSQDHFVGGIVALTLGHAWSRQGDLARAQWAYAEARATAHLIDDAYLTIAATCNLGSLQVRQGQLQQGMATYQEVIQYAQARQQQGKRVQPASGHAFIDVGEILYEWNDLYAAREQVLLGIALGEPTGHVELLTGGYSVLAHISLAQGDWAEAEETLQQAARGIPTAVGDPLRQAWIDECWVRLWLARGQLTEAERWTKQRSLSIEDELLFARDLEHLLLVRILLAQGVEQSDSSALQKAADLLPRLRQVAEEAGRVDKLIKVLNLQGLTLHALHRPDEALDALAQALRLAEPGGYIRSFLDEGPLMAELLRVAAQTEIMPEYTNKLLTGFEHDMVRSDPQLLLPPASGLAESSARTAELTHSRPSSGIPELVEPLSDRELEVLHLMADGLKYQEIADQLIVSLNTVRSHMKNIYGKLGVNNRTQAIAKASQLDLL